MVNARERRRELRAPVQYPVPEGMCPPWLPTQALKRGRRQEFNIASTYYVQLSWSKGKGYKVEWNLPTLRLNELRLPDWQQPLSHCEYRKRINDARRLFAQRVRIQQIEFATNVLTS